MKRNLQAWDLLGCASCSVACVCASVVVLSLFQQMQLHDLRCGLGEEPWLQLHF